MRMLVHSALFIAMGATSIYAEETQHPLDPLTWQEYWTVLEVLQEENHMDGDTRFSMINLKEPDKKLVWRWSEGKSTPRSAFALVRQGKKTFEAVVNIKKRRLESWEELIGVQPNWLGEEFAALKDEIREHPDVIEALRRRGIEDFAFIDFAVGPPGYFGTQEERGRRIGHVHFNDTRGVRNVWTRSIEGLTAVVDLHEKKVLRVVDEGVVPIPAAVADYDPSAIGGTREIGSPIHVDQPLNSR